MAEKNLSVKLSLNDKQFQSNLRKSTRSLKKFGDSMAKTGQTLAKNLTLPIVGLGALAVKSFDAQAKAVAQVEAGLKSTGEAAGFTSDELQKMASDLQTKTLFGDEVILKDATAQLLTFTNIAGEQFARTQVAALNLSTRLDGDLKSASIQLGKALNDPIANLSALSRSGIQFSEEQKKVIKELAETNRLAEAQTIILNELEKQYGGAAEAAAKAGLGPFQQLGNQLSDVNEQLGAIIVEGIEPLKKMLQSLADTLSGTSKETKESIVKFGALTAIIGPIIIILGKLITAFASLRSFFLLKLLPALKFVFNAFKLLTPQGRVIGLALAAATYLTANYDKVVDVFNRVKGAIFGVKEEAKGLDFSNQNITPDLSIIGDMRSGKAVNPVTGKPFYSPKPKQTKTTTRTRVNTIDRIEPKKIKEISLQFEHLTKNFKLASVEAQNFSHTISTTEQMANNIKSSFMSFGNTIQGVFAQSLQSSDGFFKSFVEGSKQAFKALLAQLAAMIAMKAILSAIGFGSLDLAANAGTSALMNILPFANGGLVTGPTLGLVGEGPGTTMSNPEVIAPLDKLKSMIGESGGGNVQVFGTIKGSDILLSSDRAKNNRNRTRGY
jgi:hypothetical protein